MINRENCSNFRHEHDLYRGIRISDQVFRNNIEIEMDKLMSFETAPRNSNKCYQINLSL